MISGAQKASGRLDAIHCLRGLAALSVCLLHLTVATTHAFSPSVVRVAGLGSFGVPVFFLISGFVVPLSLLGQGYGPRAFPRFVLRRMMRLDPPYFAVLALAVMLAVAARVLRGTPVPFRPSDVALHVGYLSGLAGRPWIVSTFWTLGIEFQFYLLIGAVLAVFLPLARRFRTAAKGPFLIGLICATSLALGELTRGLTAYVSDAQLGATWLIYKNPFLLGMVALIVRRMRLSILIVPAAGALIFGQELAEHWYYYRRLPGGDTIQQSLALIAVAMFVVLAPIEWGWMRRGSGRVLAALGTISYSLYITHPLTAGHLVAFLVGRGRMPASVAGDWAVFAVELGIAVAVATLFYWTVERPALWWSRRLPITRSAAAGAPAVSA